MFRWRPLHPEASDVQARLPVHLNERVEVPIDIIKL